MEGNNKKKELTYEQALQMLNRGEAVTCQLSNREDDTEVVREASRLNYLRNLSKEGTQMCKLYCIPQSKIKLLKNEIEIRDNSELIYYG